MAAPVIGEANLAEERSDSQFAISKLKSPNSSEDNMTIAQLSRTPHARPLSKRRKSKPMRFEVARTDVQQQLPSPNLNIVVRDPSNMCLSLRKEKSLSDVNQTPIPSSPAMIRAVELQSSLGFEFPSCIKMMVKSQVACGFWMGLPLQFCKSVLPKEDTTFILEDEIGEHCSVKYIAYKSGLSAGWKKFAIEHKLIEGDVLVFHLVEPSKFKVYIFKESVSNEMNGALSLMNLDVHTQQITPVTPSPKPKKIKYTEPLPLTTVRKKHKSIAAPFQLSIHRIEHSVNDSEETGSEVLESSRSSKPDLFENFQIIVNGLSIDSELPEDVRFIYYKLCLQEKQFLHDGIREGLYYKLVAGMIGETVNIANEIKNCKLTTTKEEFAVWDDSLRSFELLGMKVGFLRDMIRKVVKLVFESRGVVDIERYVEAENGRKRTEEEIEKLSAKILELQESGQKFGRVSGSLKRKVEKYEVKFKDIIGAPW